LRVEVPPTRRHQEVRQLVRRVLPSLALLCSALLVTLATGATAAGPAERAKALQKELDAATARYIDAREALGGDAGAAGRRRA
jgi:hypothetical protein